MTHAEVDTIEREDTEVGLQRALAPGSELLLEIAIEATDRTSAWGYPHERLGDFTHRCRVLVPATNMSVRPWATCGSELR
jgi:hypothetical protein